MSKFLNINLGLISILIIVYPFALLTGPFISDTLVVLVSLLFIIRILITKDFNFINKNYNIFFLTLFTYLIFCSLISTNKFLSLESSLFYFRHWLFCLGFAYCIIQNTKILKYFFISIILMIVLLIFDSYLQFFTGTNIINYKYDGFRLSSFFGDELILGSFLFRFFPIIVGVIFYFNSSEKVQLILLIILSIIIGSLVILSGERTAIFLFILYLLIFSIIKNQFRKLFIYTFFITILSFVIIILTNKNIEKRMINYTLNQFLEKKVETNAAIIDDNINVSHIFSNIGGLTLSEIAYFSIQHEVVYITAYKIFLDNTIFGIGPKNFREVCKLSQYSTYNDLDTSIDGCQTHPHNIHLQILTETGIIGYLFFLIVYVKIILLIFNKEMRINTSNNLNFLKISCLVCIFLNLFPFIPSGSIFNNYLSNLIYLPVAVYLSLTLIKQKA